MQANELSKSLREYVEGINRQYQTTRAREHSYRGVLENLLKNLLPPPL